MDPNHAVVFTLPHEQYYAFQYREFKPGNIFALYKISLNTLKVHRNYMCDLDPLSKFDHN